MKTISIALLALTLVSCGDFNSSTCPVADTTKTVVDTTKSDTTVVKKDSMIFPIDKPNGNLILNDTLKHK